MTLKVLILLIAHQLHADPFTTGDRTRNAFGNPFPSLSTVERREFSVGNSFFRLAWVQSPSSTPARDGLGPTFNAVSCAACHQLDGRGVGAREGFAHVSLLFRLSGVEETYGGQLNPFAVHGVKGEGLVSISFTNQSGQFPDGEAYELRRPLYEIQDWLLGRPKGSTRLSARVGTQLIGLGLLERIPRSKFESKADPHDRDNDGISGRISEVMNLRTGRLDIGRFGWKAEQPTVEQQNAAAFNGDMGLTTSLHPVDNCPAPQLDCIKHRGSELDVSDRILARVTHYTQTLAIPARLHSTEADKGERIFKRIGCASCHTPHYEIDGVAISPFTDLLLHDMGEGLSDTDLDGRPLATEWRTPPLWGIGLFQTVNGHQNLLHDGRARGAQEAILWHGGEAATSRERFVNLTRADRQNLILFLNSL